MKTGICTTDFEPNRPLRDADGLFALIREMGYECVQFAFSSIAETGFVPNGQLELPGELPSAAVRAAEKASAAHGLPIRVINATFNMAHPDRRVREEGLRRLALLCEAAASMNVPYLSLCSGTRCAAHLWTWSEENDSDEAWRDMRDTMLRAVELAEKNGVTLAIESEASNVIDTPENARRIMDDMGSERLKMILDCANLFGRGHAHPDEVKSVIGHAMDLFGDDVVIAHGKDIQEGDGISFCGTGLGIVDFSYTASLLRAHGYAGDMFLHGIYDEGDMIRARMYWENASRV